MIKKIFDNRTVKNAGWLIAGKMVQMVISLLVGILTARYLGPSNYGLINYATAYTAFFMAFCTLGINSILVKELIDHPQQEGKILGTTLVLRAISSFCSAGIIIAVVSVLEADEPTAILVTALCSLGLLFHIFDTFNYWFQSKLRSKVTAAVTLVAYIITAAYKVVMLILGKDVAWFAFATALDYICVGIMLLVCYHRSGGQRLGFSWDTGKRLLRQSVHFILPSLMVSIYGYADKFMLKHMLSQTEVGYYSTAVSVCGLWCFVLAAIIDSMYPSIMEANEQGPQVFEKRNRQLYAIVFYLAVGVSVAYCVFGELIIGILYGKQYLPAVIPLRVVTWYTAFSYLGVARDAWIVCQNKQRYLKYIYICAAVANVVLNALLIPVWGTAGAALASLVTQISTVLVVPFFIRDLRRNPVLILEAICLKDIK